MADETYGLGLTASVYDNIVGEDEPGGAKTTFAAPVLVPVMAAALPIDMAVEGAKGVGRNVAAAGRSVATATAAVAAAPFVGAARTAELGRTNAGHAERGYRPGDWIRGMAAKGAAGRGDLGGPYR